MNKRPLNPAVILNPSVADLRHGSWGFISPTFEPEPMGPRTQDVTVMHEKCAEGSVALIIEKCAAWSPEVCVLFVMFGEISLGPAGISFRRDVFTSYGQAVGAFETAVRDLGGSLDTYARTLNPPTQ